jgi:hypothetical protein
LKYGAYTKGTVSGMITNPIVGGQVNSGFYVLITGATPSTYVVGPPTVLTAGTVFNLSM